MRALVLSLASVVFMASPALSARERPAVPSPRTVDYEWMSVATWREKHETNVARATRGDADILLLGDSITEGWANTTLWQERFPTLKVANFGIGGDTTSNLLWRLENGEMGNLKPRLIVLLIGVNNLGRNGDAPAKVVEGIQAIVSTLHSRMPAARIAIVGVLPADEQPKSKMRKRIAETNRRLARNLHDGHSIFVIDAGKSLLEQDGSISSATMADFLHPTPAGYQRLADELFPQIVRILAGR